ncbi:MAG: hypothetical protein KGI27_15055, partial [Thaumarchaeota archaeon]|nr:hypothetical protein [Nitrososphaerota archaeon]
SGYKYYGETYGANAMAQADSASATFTLTNPALVVVVALPGGETYVNLQGLSGMKIDAAEANQTENIPMVIAHSYLDAGTYTVSEFTQPDGGQVPEHEADLIGVFAFSNTPGGFVSQPVP